MSVKSNPSSQESPVELDGRDVVRWLASTPIMKSRWLKGAKYYDDKGVWTITEIEADALFVQFEDAGADVRRQLNFFREGVFEVERKPNGKQIESWVRQAMPEEDRLALDARKLLAEKKFRITSLPSALQIIIADQLRRFDVSKALPTKSVWEEIYYLLKDNINQHAALCVIELLEKWMDLFEKEIGQYDTYRRVCVATLFRHARQFKEADRISTIVMGSKNLIAHSPEGLAMLYKVRAAVLMDMAEFTVTSRSVINGYLGQARELVNRSYAICDGDDEYAGNVYNRLASLEARFVINRNR